MMNKEEMVDTLRFDRHISLPEVGVEGQLRLLRSSVLVVGAGGLGSPVLLYLAAAGIGRIGLIDDDVVSISNLQRQVLYDTPSLGESKVLKASERLRALYPQCCVEPHLARLTEENAEETINAYNIVVDATDNLSTRYLIDRVCASHSKPFVYGSICEWEGQLSVFNYRGGPSYRDLYPYHDGIESFEQPRGVIGALPGVIGSIQAIEVIKIILDRQEEVLSGTLLMINLLKGSFQRVRFR